jgi:hypothetical protein
MGFASKEEIIKKLRQLDYLPAFPTAYPTDTAPLSSRNYGKALEAYQASFLTPAPFDLFLTGDDGALSKTQKDGLRV